MLNIKYTSEDLSVDLPSWWSFLNEIGQWGYENKGCYVCVIAPDEIYSSLALLSSFIQLEKTPDISILKHLEVQPFCYFKQGDKWFKSKFIHQGNDGFNTFEIHSNGRQIIKSTDLASRVRCVKREIIDMHSQPWVTNIRRGHKVEYMQTVSSKILIYGNKVKLYDAINQCRFSVTIKEKEYPFSMGNLLGVVGSKNESVGNENVFIHSHINPKKEDSDLEIWAGFIPKILPEESCSVIITLRANDPDLEEKIDEFLRIRRQLLGRKWKSLIKNEAIQCDKLKEIITKKPNNIGITAYKYIKE